RLARRRESALRRPAAHRAAHRERTHRGSPLPRGRVHGRHGGRLPAHGIRRRAPAGRSGAISARAAARGARNAAAAVPDIVRDGVHGRGEEATEALEQAREAVRRLLRARSAGEVVFTRGTTESINLVAQGWLVPRLQPGDEIVVTELEHHSNLLPWQRAAAE